MVYKDYRVREETDKTIWNMDDAILRTIHELKIAFITYMHLGDLENSYWIARQIRMEIESKLKENEQKELENKLKKLEEKRKDALIDKNDLTKRSNFYLTLENFYISLNRYMKKYGFFFREFEDLGGL